MDRRQLFSLAKWSCLLSVRPSSSPPPTPPLLKSMHVNFPEFWLDYSGTGAKRATTDYAVPFRPVWEHLGPLCGSNQHDHAPVKMNVLMNWLQRVRTRRKRRTTPHKFINSTTSAMTVFSKLKGLNLLVKFSLNVFFFSWVCSELTACTFYCSWLNVDGLELSCSESDHFFPHIKKRQINKSTPIMFSFVLMCKWTNDLKCELSWLCIQARLTEVMRLKWKLGALCVKSKLFKMHI